MGFERYKGTLYCGVLSKRLHVYGQTDSVNSKVPDIFPQTLCIFDLLVLANLWLLKLPVRPTCMDSFPEADLVEMLSRCQTPPMLTGGHLKGGTPGEPKLQLPHE